MFHSLSLEIADTPVPCWNFGCVATLAATQLATPPDAMILAISSFSCGL